MPPCFRRHIDVFIYENAENGKQTRVLDRTLRYGVVASTRLRPRVVPVSLVLIARSLFPAKTYYPCNAPWASMTVAAKHEITWEAEADIVSGLGGFIVLRDGRGIAKLPTQPPEAVYGRPLFQGLSYHDTPFAPLPQMRHLDMSAEPGAKHVYTVIALSSAGVPSVPSLPVAIE